MKLTRLNLKNYRNLSELSMEPCDHVNIIYGDNAQGKTNILEAIWLFTGNHSFRGSRQSELIQFQKNFCECSISFENRERVQQINLRYGNKKSCTLNQVPLKTASELAGHFYGVIFSPDDLELVKGSPTGRRKFLDYAITQLSPQYRNYLDQYEKILEQRNSLLREIPKNSSLKDTLFIWDDQLAKIGTILMIYRMDYVQKLSIVVNRLYEGMTGEKTMEIEYHSTVFDHPEQIKSYEDEYIQKYQQKIESSIENDIRFGHTTVGIHRDDLDLKLGGLLIRNFGSQGQQRSTVLLLKLAEAELLQHITGEPPVILLDDVMSELDAKRQHYILNQVKSQQVFITCCDIYNTFRLEQGKIFQIRNGALIEETVIQAEKEEI